MQTLGMVDRRPPLGVGSCDDMRIKAEYVIHLGQMRWRKVCPHRCAVVVCTGYGIAFLEIALAEAGLADLGMEAAWSCLSAASWPVVLAERVPLVEIPKILHGVRGPRDVS